MYGSDRVCLGVAWRSPFAPSLPQRASGTRRYAACLHRRTAWQRAVSFGTSSESSGGCDPRVRSPGPICSDDSGPQARLPEPNHLVRMRGLEPPRAFAHTDLNRARLPIPPHPRGEAIVPAALSALLAMRAVVAALRAPAGSPGRARRSPAKSSSRPASPSITVRASFRRARFLPARASLPTLAETRGHSTPATKHEGAREKHEGNHAHRLIVVRG